MWALGCKYYETMGEECYLFHSLNFFFSDKMNFLKLKFKSFDLKGWNDKTNAEPFEKMFTYWDFKINFNFPFMIENT